MNKKVKKQMESMLASSEMEGIYADEYDRREICDVLEGKYTIEDLIVDLMATEE